MFVSNVNDEDLCKLIYKAGVLEFPKYCDLFNGDLEEFQQHCALLILPKLKKYNENKGALSTYIYNFLPLLLGHWYARTRESKIMLFELNKLSLDNLSHGDDWDVQKEYTYLFADDVDIPKDIMEKDLNKILEKIMLNYPALASKEMDGLTFRQLGRKLNVSERRAQYLYIKDLIEVRKKYNDLLKSLLK